MSRATKNTARTITIPALVLLLGCGRSERVLFSLDAGTKAADAGDVDASEAPADAGLPPASCGEFRQGPDFRLCSAGYLGSATDDEPTAIAYAADGSLLVAGRFGDLGAPEQTLIEGGAGALVWLDASGQTVKRVLRLGDRVADVAVAEDGFIAVTGAFGWAILSPDGSSITDRGSLPAAGLRIALIGERRAAVLAADKTLHWVSGFSDQTLSLSDERVEDLALDPRTSTLFVTGAHAVTGGCLGLVPFLRSYDATGALLDSVYDQADAQGNCASSRGVRVQMGRDGKLYYGGENSGGNTVHLRDPRDLSSPARLVSYDPFTAGYGKATETYGFAARFAPDTLTLELGQVLLPRSGDTGGTLRVSSIDADAKGQIYFGGQASCCLAGRDELRFGDLTPGPAQLAETSLVLLASDFSRRLAWLTWSGADAPESRVVDVALGESSVAVLAKIEDGSGRMLTVGGPELNHQGGADAFLSVFPRP